MASTFRIALGTAGFVVPVTVTILDLFGYVAKVEGASMQPALNPADQKAMDYVLLDRWSIRDYKFQRGEVISLSSPVNSDQKIIKRIIGLEGDTVKTLSYKNRYIKIPEGHCWVEGDHHGQSLDSNMFGPVAMGLINSRASYIVWPPSRWRRMSLEPAEGRITVNDTSHSRHADITKDASVDKSGEKKRKDDGSAKAA